MRRRFYLSSFKPSNSHRYSLASQLLGGSAGAMGYDWATQTGGRYRRVDVAPTSHPIHHSQDHTIFSKRKVPRNVLSSI